MSLTRGPHRVQQTEMRQRNLAISVEVLRDRGSVTVAELSRLTGLSRPTVESILAELIENGLASDAGSEAADTRGVGRPAKLYSFRPEAHLVASVDAGLHRLVAILANLRGEVLVTIERRIEADVDVVERTEMVRRLLRDLLQEGGFSMFSLHTVVVSVPGIVDPQGRMILSNPIPGWTGVHLAARFGEGLSAKVTVENDINMATLGEHAIGAGVFADDLILVHVGHRMNAGLILGGRLHRGHSYSAGELADIHHSGWTELLGQADPADLDGARSVLARAAAGDSDALEALRVFASQIAGTITSVSAAVDPDLVVIGGGLSGAGETLVGPIRDAVVTLIQPRPAPAIVASRLGADGTLLGGLVRAYQLVNERLYQAPDLAPPRIVRDGPVPRRYQSPPAVQLPSEVTVSKGALRVGVVGIGARSLLARWVNEPGMDAHLVAAADPHPLALARAADRLGNGVEVVASHHDLLTMGLDAVFVTSPDDTHAEITCDLLEAGVAVYLEKPLATSAADADRVLTTAYRTGTRLYVGHNMRHMAVVRQLRDIIQRGEIGQVKAIWCRHFVGNGGDYYFKDWHAEREHSTGLLLQKGAHDIDVMHWLAGSYTREVVGMGDLMVYDQVRDRADHSDELMPDWFSLDHWPPLSQRGLNPVIDVEDLSMVLMRMESGVLASYQQCHFTPDYWRNYTVIGTEGRAENFGDGDGGVVRVWNARTEYSPNGDREYPIRGDAFGHDDADGLTVAEFLRFVRTGEPTETSPLGAREAVMTGIAATESIRDGSTPRPVPPVAPEVASYFESHQNRVSVPL